MTVSTPTVVPEINVSGTAPTAEPPDPTPTRNHKEVPVPRHIVEVQTLTHTCAGNPEPHAVDTWRALLDTISTGPCTNPRTIHCGDATVAVDCGTVLPADRRCAGCTVTVEIKHAMTTHVGEEPTCTSPAPTGLLPHPCPHCGLPVSAIFAATGRHLLCPAPGAAR